MLYTVSDVSDSKIMTYSLFHLRIKGKEDKGQEGLRKKRRREGGKERRKEIKFISE